MQTDTHFCGYLPQRGVATNAIVCVSKSVRTPFQFPFVQTQSSDSFRSQSECVHKQLIIRQCLLPIRASTVAFQPLIAPSFFFMCLWFNADSKTSRFCSIPKLEKSLKHKASIIIEGLRAKRAYIAFLADFHFLQDRANFWQTDLF